MPEPCAGLRRGDGLQVEATHRARARFIWIPVGVALLATFSGCHHAPSPDVVATVNGKDILRAEMERNYKASVGDRPQETSPEQADIARLTILDRMIEDEILQQRAAKLNLAA